MQRVACVLVGCLIAAGIARAQTVTAIANAASYVTDQVAPGSIASIFGVNLAATTAVAAGEWPTTLGGTTVRVNGAAVPLSFVSPNQINFQMPNNALGTLPTQNASVTAGSAPPHNVVISASAPGIFVGSGGWAVAQNQDSSLNQEGNPARAGSYITVYLTGIGAVDRLVPAGLPTPDAPLSRALAPVTATIGGQPANVAFAGLTPRYVGLAQVNLQVPDLPAGAYPLAITVGRSVSNSAKIAVAGGSPRTKYELTTAVGDGVVGSPARSTATHLAGSSAPYSFAPATGFGAPVVEIDGAAAPPSGSVLMDRDRWLWTFAQPTTGTEFPDHVTAPAGAAAVPYPAFFEKRPAQPAPRLADPYCAIRTQTVAYPRSFLGAFPLPPITGAPLPANILRGISLKDYWGCCLGRPSMNNGCGGTMHDAFRESAARVKSLGADHLHVTTWAYVTDASSATPALDLASPEITDSEMAFIAAGAKAAGLDVWLDVNIPANDRRGGLLPRTPSQQWEASFLDSYAQFIVQTARMAEKNGVKAMMFNWRDFYIDLKPYLETYAAKLVPAMAQVRRVYSGKVLFYDVVSGERADINKIAELYRDADAIMIDPSTQILTAEENRDLTFAKVKQKYKRMFTWMAWKFEPFGKPLVMTVLLQSHRNFLVTGWVEDAFCVDGCVQRSLQTDFSVQAIAYQALFEAAMESGLEFLSIDPYGYWYVDVMLPKDSFPNISQSPRNKPAESVIWHWFRK